MNENLMENYIHKCELKAAMIAEICCYEPVAIDTIIIGIEISWSL